MYESLLTLPESFSFRYYATAIEKIQIVTAFGNSLFLTVVSIFSDRYAVLHGCMDAGPR